MYKFIKSASNETHFINDDVKEVCVIGRSNVGKSSLINAIAHSKIAKTSSTPGRTQLINYFDFGSFRLVDLPGYGFAKVSKQKQNEINKIIFEYLTKSKNLESIFHICDANVIMQKDIDMANEFFKLKKRYFLVLNKVDKQKMYRYKNELNKIAKMFKIDINQIILVSAEKNINIKELETLMTQSTK